MLKKFILGAFTGMSLMFSGLAFALETHYAIIGDAGKKNTNSLNTRSSIQRTGVSQLILPGDNLYGFNFWGGYEDVWDSWKKMGFTFNLVAIGNHNLGYQKEITYFGMHGEYYSKVENGSRFIVLNSDNDSSGPEQAMWLDEELSAATEPFIFIIYHHPTYTVSKKHSWTEKKKFQLALRPVLWRYRAKLTALLVGHDHLATLIHFNDLPVILSGAVQEARADVPIDNIQDGVTVKTSWYFDGRPHWAKLTIDPDQTFARVDFIKSVGDQIKLTAILETGKAAVVLPQ